MAREVDRQEVARYEAWAKRLDLGRSRRTACPCSLLGRRCCAYGRGFSGFSGVPSPECRELCDPHGSTVEWDHERLWVRGRRPILAVSELYGYRQPEHVAGRLAGRLDASLFTVILASASGPHSNWNPGSCTPVMLVAKQHRAARELVRDLLDYDPEARIIAIGDCS